VATSSAIDPGGSGPQSVEAAAALLAGPLSGLFDDTANLADADPSPLAALVLHAMLTGDVTPLLAWFAAAGETASPGLVVLDTADEVPLVPGDHLSADDVAHLVRLIGRGSTLPGTGQAGAVTLPCSLYAAAGEDDVRLLLARLVQLFAPGVPCVPVEGLLPLRLPAQDGTAAALRRPVVEAVLRLIRLRREHPAFGGRLDCGPGRLVPAQATSAEGGAPSRPLTAVELRAQLGGPQVLRGRRDDALAGPVPEPATPASAAWLRWVDGEHQVVLQIVPDQDTFRLALTTQSGWAVATSVREVCLLELQAAG
jgi:hypothetical protein